MKIQKFILYYLNIYPAFSLVQVRGINGVYIANQLSPITNVPNTKITYDKGGDWVVIPAPDKDASGKPNNCNQVRIHRQPTNIST